MLSPTTPVGLPRKHRLCTQTQVLQSITFDEDIEMVVTLTDPMTCSENSETPRDRKLIKGLRRLDIANGQVGKKLTWTLDEDKDNNEVNEACGVTKCKGKSIKVLKCKSRERTKNYKRTRKKNNKIAHDTRQKLIDQFFSRKPTHPNEILVGIDANESKEEPDMQASEEDNS